MTYAVYHGNNFVGRISAEEPVFIGDNIDSKWRVEKIRRKKHEVIVSEITDQLDAVSNTTDEELKSLAERLMGQGRTLLSAAIITALAADMIGGEARKNFGAMLSDFSEKTTGQLTK